MENQVNQCRISVIIEAGIEDTPKKPEMHPSWKTNSSLQLRESVARNNDAAADLDARSRSSTKPSSPRQSFNVLLSGEQNL